ncbi:Bug family tripartite tricarboxylate transporter substrate binding protein [Amycolatopsis thermoflava]|uniref:Tripartite-type tricarboxylate transporter receptor subunit TctC n=1 Tax=Amycolatopsis thermoflava TaxID=84480 RepID=A0A3N2GPH1_9PSEU|nr:tripartite tricarboxylate transporter substrate binding protein [Amycolatopsis thermoflava]ROS38491.1 tripartite-type tricarboxylate transporter receptor subunit TctC [Amycolatopsis thermoflava]
MRRLRASTAVLVSGVLALSACAPPQSAEDSAASYPDRPIELVVPFDPGGGTDLTARVIANALSDELGVPVNVVNKPGAEQVTGVDYVRKSRPDGYTLLADGAASSSIQSFKKDLPFAWDDRTFIGRVTSGAHAYAVAADSPYTTLDQLITALKQDPKKFRTSWSGGATTSDLTLLSLLRDAQVEVGDLTRVPYRSSGDAMQAVVSDLLDFGVGGATATFSLAQSKDLRVLAVTGDKPVAMLGGVPTTAALGHPELDVTYWVGLSGPPGMPAAINDRLEDAIASITRNPDVLKQLDNIGVNGAPLTGQPFADYVRGEVTTFTELRRLAGATG